MALSAQEENSRPEASETKTIQHAKAVANKNDVKTSKFESFCKVLAVVIVIIAFVGHLLRGAQEGKFSA